MTLPLEDSAPAKRCAKCAEVKLATEYNSRAASPDGLQARCRACQGSVYMLNRERSLDLKLLRLYGISRAGMAELLMAQGRRCGNLEGGAELRIEGPNRPCVDHDHDSGEIRGLLCGRCNSGIGFLGDRSGVVRGALEYLERYEERETA